MFGINFSEWLLILVVGFVVIGPKELPVVIRHIASLIREVRGFTSGIRAQMHAMAREAGMEDIFDGTGTIIDLEGKPQKAYDVRELKTLSSPPPIGGLPQDESSHQTSPPPNLPPMGGGIPLRGIDNE